MDSVLINVLSLLNSSETIDRIYPELQQLLRDNFNCAELVFVLSDSAEDGTIYIWDAAAHQLDAYTRLPRLNLHPSFVAHQPVTIPEIDVNSPHFIDNLLCGSNMRSYCALPLIHDVHAVGMLIFAWECSHGFRPSQIPEFEQIVRAIAATLVRAMRVSEMRDTLRNTRALYSASHSLISTESLKDVLNNVVNNSAVAVGSSHCTLYVFAKDTPEIKHIATYHRPLLAPLTPLTYDELMDGLIGWSIHNRQPAQLRKSEASIRSDGAMLVAPVIYRQHVLGVLTVHNTTMQTDFDDDDLALLSSLANQAAVAIAKARLYDDRKRQVKMLAGLRDFSLKMQGARSLDKLLATILQEFDSLLQPDLIEINLIEADETVLVAIKPENVFPIGFRFPIQQGVTGAVARSGKIEIIPNLHTDERAVLPDDPSEFLQKLKTTVCLPLLDDNKLVGILNMAFQTVREFDSADHALFQAITSLIGGALQHVMLLESLEDHVRERNQQFILANQELQEANTQLQQLDKLKNKFISDVSHELRTPLTSLGLYLDLLERRPDRQAHYLDVVRGEVNRLRVLVLDVLKIARYDSKRIAVNFQSVCMTEIVMREVALHRERAEAVGIEVVLESDSHNFSIMGDSTQLSEMVTALLYNAINYTQQGIIELKLAYIPMAKALELSITDSGIGIPADEIDHVFERFYRGSNVSMFAGSGLGLNLVQEIVNLHNGYIDLTSQLNKGTIVKVLLPVIQNSDVRTEATHAAKITISK